MRTKLGRANRAYFHLIAAIAAASLVGLQACGDDFENCGRPERVCSATRASAAVRHRAILALWVKIARVLAVREQ